MPTATDATTTTLGTIANALLPPQVMLRQKSQPQPQTTQPDYAQPTPAVPTKMDFSELIGLEVSKQIEKLHEMLEVELRIRDGAENMIEAKSSGAILLRQVEGELASAKARIALITRKIEQLKEQVGATRAPRKKPTGLLNGSTDLNGARRALGSTSSTHPNGASKDDPDRDEYLLAMGQANLCIKGLANLPKPNSRRSHFPGASPPPSMTTTPQPVAVDAETDRQRVEIMNALVEVMQRCPRIRLELDPTEIIKAVSPGLSDYCSAESRSGAYRVLRQTMVHRHGPRTLADLNVDWYLVRSLSRDSKHVAEKEQVLLLIRALIDSGSVKRTSSTATGCGSVPIREHVARALVSVAEHEEDPFRLVTLEMLAEILLIDLELIHRAEGLKVLLQALIAGPPELSPILASAFLAITDLPQTRRYLKVGSDLELGLSGITDAYGRQDGHQEQMKATSRVVITILRSWSGLVYMCMNNKLAIRTLIETLRIPSLDTRDVVLDMFFELLNIKSPEWYRAFLDGRRLTMYGRNKSQISGADPNARGDKPTLVDQYLALLLTVLTSAGLLDALISIVQEPDVTANISRKATLLVGEMLQMSNRLLPLTAAARIQALPRLFNLACDFSKGENRKIGTSTLSSIDSFNRNRARLQTNPQKDVRTRANSINDPMQRGQRQIEQMKLKNAMQLEDSVFRQMIMDSRVNLTRDHAAWNFSMLTELFEGALLNSRRLEEALKGSKFMKRILAFYNPTVRKFSDLKNTHANAQWVRLGNVIMSTLVKCEEGYRFLQSDDGFLKDVSDALAQLDPWNGNTNFESVFSKQHVEDTLSYGYFEMLGTLSKYPYGLQLLEQYKFFTAFYHLSDLKFREDLIKGIIENLDYTTDGHSRIVLSKALTSNYKHIRLYATQYLGKLILNTKQANSWTLRLLLTQLYDPAMDVKEMAVNLLEEACESREVLQMVVAMQPTLDHLGELGHPLLLKFMSTASGFQYLYQTEYIEREMEAWFHERNSQYVVLVEVWLSKAFTTDPAEDGEDMISFDGIAPPHFYGEMVKTELGCQVLSDKGHFNDFTHFIRQHGLDSDDAEIILKLKSFLWAVGNIGACERGVPFLEEEDILPMILDIAEQSPVLSVRGTCFFVLGLIASTSQGAELLSDYGWMAASGPLGDTTGMIVPEDLEKFLLIPTWQVPLVSTHDRRLPPLKSQLERHILDTIENLCNTVISQAASRTLSRLKAKPETRHVFSSIPLLHRALHTISTRRYRWPVRRYVLELFDVKLDSFVIDELAHLTKVANDELLSTGGQTILVAERTSIANKRKTRQSMRPRSRRKSTVEGDEDTAAWLAENEKETVVKVKPKERVVGFDSEDS